MNFSEQAKQLKEQSGMTQRDIAEKCQISESTVSRYLSGTTVPPDDMAHNILEALGGGSSEIENEGEEEMQAALAMVRELYEARILDMQATIDDLKERVISERKERWKERHERWIVTLVLVIVVTAFFAMIFIDLSNGNIGWFRH